MKNFSKKIIGLFLLVFGMTFTNNAQELGDLHQGFYIFQINDDNTVLITNAEVQESLPALDAISNCYSLTDGGFDWFLPTIEQYQSMYSVLGPENQNEIGNNLSSIEDCWSSETQNNSGTRYYSFNWMDGETYYANKNSDYSSICAASISISELAQEVMGCTDETASNYNSNSNTDDGSCISWEEVVSNLQADLDAAMANQEDGVSQADVDAAYAEGAASVTPEDGVSQSDLDEAVSAVQQQAQIDAENAFNDGEASGYEVGYSEGYDIGFQNGAASVTPEDGISQSDVDAAYAAGAASVTPEDGIGQADVDAAYANGAASVEIPECEEVATQNIPLDLPQGWSMFGYTCLESLDVVDAFSDISNNLEIVKDEWGLAYLPAWGYSAFDNLEFGEGYLIKMTEEVSDFQFCTTIAGGASQDELDAAYAEGAASVIPEDGIGQADLDAAVAALEASYAGWIEPIYGCTGTDYCNYNPLANMDDGSCVYAQEGFDCDGNLLLQIGDQYAGGMVFQINEDGTGLVADVFNNLGQETWDFSMNATESSTSEGYEDWYLPSLEELELMYNTIGKGGSEGNIGGFPDNQYWSSSEIGNSNAWTVHFSNGTTNGPNKGNVARIIGVRAF